MSKNTYMDTLVAAERGDVDIINPVKRIIHAARWAGRIISGANPLVIETCWYAGELGPDGRTRPYWNVNVYVETWTWFTGIHKLRVGFGSLSGDQCRFHLIGKAGEITIPPTKAVYALAADPESGCEVSDIFAGLTALANASVPLPPTTWADLNEAE